MEKQYNIASTTDSDDQVLAAKGGKADDQVKNDDAKSEALKTKAENADDSESLESEESEEEIIENDESEETEENEESEKPKKKSGFKRRIESFQRKLSEKDQEIEFYKKLALKEKSDSSEAKPVNKAEKQGDDSRPDPNDFDTQIDYIEALTDWKLDQKEKIKSQKEVEKQKQTEAQKKADSFQKSITEFKKIQTDFDEVLAEASDLEVSPIVQDLIIESEHSARLVYELAKNQELAIKLNSLNPIQIAKELGKIEAKFSDSSNEIKQIKVSKAPPPLSPVSPKTSKVNKSPEEMDYQEYKLWRAKQK